MNQLEIKANLLSRTPQELWFEGRYKPMGMYLQGLMSNGAIKSAATIESLCDLEFLKSQGLKFEGLVFEYDNSLYFWVIVTTMAHGETIIECVHLETLNKDIPFPLLAARILLSSNDDKDQETYIPLFSTFSGKTTLPEFIDFIHSKMISI